MPLGLSSSCGKCLLSSFGARRALNMISLQRSIPNALKQPSGYFNTFYPSLRPISAALLAPRSTSLATSRLLPHNYFSHSIQTSAVSRSAATLATPHDPPIQEHKLPALPTLTHPIVAYYLIGIATLVFAIVVIGGLTRLTESGLSITEWNLVTGTLPPLNEDQWLDELRKYRLSPEGRLCAIFALTLLCNYVS